MAVQVKTPSGHVFEVNSNGQGNTLSYFYDGEIKTVPGTYASAKLVDRLRGLYLHFKEQTQDRTSDKYRDRLVELINVAAIESFDGKKGVALLLTQKGEYDLRFHKDTVMEVVTDSAPTTPASS